MSFLFGQVAIKTCFHLDDLSAPIKKEYRLTGEYIYIEHLGVYYYTFIILY